LTRSGSLGMLRTRTATGERQVSSSVALPAGLARTTSTSFLGHSGKLLHSQSQSHLRDNLRNTSLQTDIVAWEDWLGKLNTQNTELATLVRFVWLRLRQTAAHWTLAAVPAVLSTGRSPFDLEAITTLVQLEHAVTRFPYTGASSGFRRPGLVALLPPAAVGGDEILSTARTESDAVGAAATPRVNRIMRSSKPSSPRSDVGVGAGSGGGTTILQTVALQNAAHSAQEAAAQVAASSFGSYFASGMGLRSRRPSVVSTTSQV
jgi:hypothetical protein